MSTETKELTDHEKQQMIYAHVEKRFGPRPTDPDLLLAWKNSRFPYLYGGLEQVYARVLREKSDE